MEREKGAELSRAQYYKSYYCTKIVGSRLRTYNVVTGGLRQLREPLRCSSTKLECVETTFRFRNFQ